MKLTISTALLVGLLTQPALASHQSPAPQACPNVTAIQSAGVNMARLSSMFGWMVYNMKDNLGTPEQWSFVMYLGGAANDETDAIAKATVGLKTLAFVEGPAPADNDHYRWSCVYRTDPGFYAGAVTPPVELLSNIFSRYKN